MKYNRARVCGSKPSKNVVTHIRGARGAGNSNETTEFVNHGELITDINDCTQIVVFKGIMFEL